MGGAICAKRSASILLAMLCCLAALATSASAECAWVLWSEATAGGGSGPHLKPVSGFPSSTACAARAAELMAAQDAEQSKTSSARIVRLGYTCLPDTVDPRGPTGK